MALSDIDRRYVQYMTGIGTAEAVFTNTQLDEWYTDSGSDRDATILTVLYALQADVARLYDYRLAQTEEKRSQVFRQLESQIARWESKGKASQQVINARWRTVPPKDREEPSS